MANLVFVLFGLLAASSSSAIADDWGFSSEGDADERRCFAMPGDQTGAAKIRLALDDSGLAFEVGNASWKLDPGTAYRSALVFDNGEEESAIADVLTPTVFRVLISEAENGKSRASNASRLAVKRGDAEGAPYFELHSETMAFAISQLDACRNDTIAAAQAVKGAAGVMTVQMREHIQTLFGEPMQIVASNDQAMLLESDTYTVFLHREGAGMNSSAGGRMLSVLMAETFPDCSINSAKLPIEIEQATPVRWTASAVTDCLGKDLIVSAASGPDYFNASMAINHGSRLKRRDIAGKLAVASLLQ